VRGYDSLTAQQSFVLHIPQSLGLVRFAPAISTNGTLVFATENAINAVDVTHANPTIRFYPIQPTSGPVLLNDEICLLSMDTSSKSCPGCNAIVSIALSKFQEFHT
jgi:hypothetical protein